MSGPLPPPAAPRTSPRPLRLAGYAALFDIPDAARDRISPGAFAASLAERRGPLPLYWQHRPDQRIGWVDRAVEDARGLRVLAQIDNPDGRAAQLLKAGAVSGLSFGFRARRASHGAQGRRLHVVDIFEVSLVTHPLQHTARVHLFA